MTARRTSNPTDDRSPRSGGVAPSGQLPCRVHDPDLWFAEAPADLELAKRHCGHCPVRRGCLAGALNRGEPWGVWGGEIIERGAVIARKRRRGRPSKADLERDRAERAGPGRPTRSATRSHHPRRPCRPI